MILTLFRREPVLRVGFASVIAVFAFLPFPTYAQSVPIVDQTPIPTYFDGTRADPVQWDSDPGTLMPTWSIAAVVKPTAATASGSSRTIATNDLGGWNDDLLFGVCPEVSSISPPGRWTAIHQDQGTQERTVAVAYQDIESDTRYHVVVTSDGDYLRLYVNGRRATYPIRKKGDDLDFGYPYPIGGVYIGGNGNFLDRYFEGDIESVKIWDVALSDDEIIQLAHRAGVYGFDADPRLLIHTDDVTVEGDNMDQVTSIDFVNGFEVLTDLDSSRFLYRTIGEEDWSVATELSEPVNQPHSITWTDAVVPSRYFVADTDNNRIVSFQSLTDQAIFSETGTVAAFTLTRPHDLEYNDQDGFFYGVTAPYLDSGYKGVFRFRDVGVDEGFRVLAPYGVSADGSYFRSLTIVEGVVYVVDSFGENGGSPPFHPRVFVVSDFDDPNPTPYFTAASTWTSEMQSVEFHEGWWYGTGTSLESYGPLLARWRTWDDFENGSWEDLSDLVPGTAPRNAYFLTEWNGRLFFTVWDREPSGRHDWVVEIDTSTVLIFRDGFESGDTSHWSQVIP